ncbi:hypothetical protein POTOM_018143 [Populus tomentosa]|uniref:Lactoylglutathione lyase n=1 Tax=Populus tomentosa TaxID=118781 RepID=A0A8X8A1I1_POPTO|nr:hypothetical protein POTOM_018143 [Populus tomentosa]
MATACSLTTATALLARLPFLEFTPRTSSSSHRKPNRLCFHSRTKDDYPKQEVTFTVSVRISGNIGVTVDDTYKACERFERLDMESVSLVAGKMKGIAFIKDPDGYWIEIFDLKTIGKVTETAV